MFSFRNLQNPLPLPTNYFLWSTKKSPKTGSKLECLWQCYKIGTSLPPCHWHIETLSREVGLILQPKIPPIITREFVPPRKVVPPVSTDALVMALYFLPSTHHRLTKRQLTAWDRNRILKQFIIDRESNVTAIWDPMSSDQEWGEILFVVWWGFFHRLEVPPDGSDFNPSAVIHGISRIFREPRETTKWQNVFRQEKHYVLTTILLNPVSVGACENFVINQMTGD